MSASIAIQSEASLANSPSSLPPATPDSSHKPGAKLSANENPFTGTAAEGGDAHTRTPRGIGSGMLKLFAKSAASPPPFKIPRPQFDAPPAGARIPTDIPMRPMSEPVAGPSGTPGRSGATMERIDSGIHERTPSTGSGSNSKSSAATSDVEAGTSRPKADAPTPTATADSVSTTPRTSTETLSIPPRSPEVQAAEELLKKSAKPIYRDKALSTIPEGLTEAEQESYRAGNKAYNDYVDNATMTLAETIKKGLAPREVVYEWKAFNNEGSEMAKQTMMQRYQPGSTEASLHLGNVDYLPVEQQTALKELKATLEKGMDEFRQQDTTTLSSFLSFKHSEQGLLDKSVDKANTAFRNIDSTSGDKIRNIAIVAGTVSSAVGVIGGYGLAKLSERSIVKEEPCKILAKAMDDKSSPTLLKTNQDMLINTTERTRPDQLAESTARSGGRNIHHRVSA